MKKLRLLLFLFILLSTFLSNNSLFAQCGGEGGIIINEIDYNPSPGIDNEFEFVEFLNTSNASITVSGWTFTDGEGTYTFPDPTIIPAGGFWVIEAGAIGDVSNSNDVFATGIALSNSGETVTLEDGGTTIDEVTYNDTNAWDDGNCGTAGDSDGGGQSLQVEDPCADNSVQGNWTACDPTPGTTNSLAILPVEFGKVDARNVHGKIEIHWETYSEINNDRFEIERSDDASRYETIGAVKGNGNSLKLNDYTFVDESPLTGINYYRLKQIDIDGRFEYSDMVSVEMDRSSIRITPTSTYDFVTVNTGAQSSIILRSVNGQVMNQQSNSEGNFTVEMAHYPQGIYFLTINMNGSIQTEKVVRL
ncbi:MAG: lamin tail domain-containing protein [Saprospiraceae bacterium]